MFRFNVLILAVLLLTLCAQPMKADAGMAARDVPIEICAGEGNPPYEFINDSGNPDGFFIDLIKELSEKEGFSYHLKLLPWNSAISSLYSGKSRMMLGVVFINDSDKRIIPSQPLSIVYYGIVSRPADNFRNLHDIQGKRVFVLSGSSGESVLSSIKGLNVKLIRVSDLNFALHSLQDGDGDVVFTTSARAEYEIKREKMKLVTNVANEVAPKFLGIVYDARDSLLQKKINVGIQRMMADGSYDRLVQKWLYGGNQQHKIPKWVYFAMISLVFILIVGSMFMAILRHQVKLATARLQKQKQNLHTLNDELTNSNKMLELIMQNTNSGYVYMKPDQTMVWESLSKCKGFDWSAMGKRFASRIGNHCYIGANENLCRKCKLKDAAKSRSVTKIESVSPVDGSPIEVTYIPIIGDDGEIDGFIVKYDDISEHTKLVQELTVAKEQAERSDMLKSAFLANMSHEIRTPLNAIVGFSQILVDGDYEEDEKSQYLSIINENCDMLLKLVNDILDLSKIEAGFVDLKKERVVMYDLTKGVYSTLAGKARQNKDVAFNLVNPVEDVVVEHDKRRIEQILYNYATNALKHTQKGHIDMGYTYEDGGIKLFVADTGSGIAEAKKDYVFGRFQKLNNTQQGMGLGLSICHAIAEAAGGKVWFQSTEGEGSTFWAWLPCPKLDE
jgi:ABC-type amino acid transport substrate-binding protein/nitrogen-specific signal transduction histidine kinase